MAFERKYSDEVRERSVTRVLERKRAEPRNRAIIREVAAEYDVGEQSLRQWVARYDDGSYDYRDAGALPAGSAQDALDESAGASRSLLKRIEQLEGEVAALREENDVLKRAAAIFAAELAKRG